MKDQKQIQCDLLVIGSGLSGMAASMFAAKNDLSVVQVSKHQTLGFHSGLLDVAGQDPGREMDENMGPLKILEQIVEGSARHPYAKIDESVLTASMEMLLDRLSEYGVDYRGSIEKNQRVLTSMGTLKPSCYIPSTMQAGVDGFQKKLTAKIIDIKGLRGFSSRQIVESMKDEWPKLKSAQIEFPGMENCVEVTPEPMARALENSTNLNTFIQRLMDEAKECDLIGLPPILGVQKTREIHEKLEQKLGCSVFEIPCMPPSVPGIRLKEAFDHMLKDLDVCQFNKTTTLTVDRNKKGEFLTVCENERESITILSKGLVMATGRFLGKGLELDQNEVKETLMNLPVVNDREEEGLYKTRFFDPKGHGINRIGIETDGVFRPLKLDSQPVYSNLFSIGTINAHQDWVREKSGSGIAVSSAFKAVDTFIRENSGVVAKRSVYGT